MLTLIKRLGNRRFIFGCDNVDELELLPTRTRAGHGNLSTIKSCESHSIAKVGSAKYVLSGETNEWELSSSGGSGVDGKDGLSAYELEVKNGTFTGTEEEYVKSIIKRGSDSLISVDDLPVLDVTHGGTGCTSSDKFISKFGLVTNSKIANNFKTNDTSAVLSAPMGKQLYELVTALQEKVTELEEQISQINGTQTP